MKEKVPGSVCWGGQWTPTISIYINSIQMKFRAYKEIANCELAARKLFNIAKLERAVSFVSVLDGKPGEFICRAVFPRPSKQSQCKPHIPGRHFNVSFCCFSPEALSMPAGGPFVFVQLHPGPRSFRCVHYLQFSCLLSGYNNSWLMY